LLPRGRDFGGQRQLKDLATNFDICFTVISTAKQQIETTLEQEFCAG
jgi:hypothetical protein